jgi:hypothetical protein
MISKRFILECDWCGEICLGSFDSTIKSMSKNYFIYRFKSISQLADEMWLQNKNGNFAMKYLSFCCKECADEYFKENPEDKKFYKLIEYKNSK